MSLLDWDKISQALYGDTPKSFTFSNPEVKLLLSLIDRAVNRWAWLDQTDNEWDQTLAFVDGLIFKLLNGETAMIKQFNARLSSNQNIGNGTQLALDVAEYNLEDQWDTTNYEWTVLEDGLYLVHKFLQTKNMSTGSAAISTWGILNGTTDILHSGDQVNSGSATDWVYTKSERYVYLTSGDVVTFHAWQSDSPTTRPTTDPHDAMITVFKL